MLTRREFFRKESPTNTDSWAGALKRNPAGILSSALTEKQNFIKSIYYRSSMPSLTLKPLTGSMEHLVTDPIVECINKNSQQVISRFTGKLLPTIDEWQQKRAPDTTFTEFKAILSKDLSLDESLKKALLEQYIIRIIEKHYQSVSLRDYQDPANEFIEAVVKDQEISTDLKKIRNLTNQMKRLGIDKIAKHYERIKEIKAAVFPKDIDLIINETISEYPRISALLANSPLETANAAGLDELSKDIFFAVRDKRLELKNRALKQDQIKTTFSQEDLSRNLSDQFKASFDNLMSLIPKKDRHFLDRSPYYVLRLAMAMRKILPVANAEVLAQIWWQLRLGGPRAKDIIDHVKKEWPAFVKKQKLEKYARHLADNFLGSEAAAFEFQNTVSIEAAENPNRIVFQIMKNLIRNHIPKDKQQIRFTLLDRNKRFLKIAIDYQEGLLDSQIEKRISLALDAVNHQWREIPLSVDERERAKLSYLGHNTLKRKHDKVYRAVYQGFGQNKKTGEDYDGDYLIQIGSIYEDSRDPRSLFAVDSHKAAIQLKFKEAGKISVTTRYSHQYFDGQPAKLHTDSIVLEINKSEETKTKPPEIIPEEQNDLIEYLKDNLEQPGELELPLVESRTDYDDTYEYSSISLGGDTYISSTELRSLTIARANNIQYFQQLVANKNTRGSYFVRNPNANNIQPVILAPFALNRQNRVLWIKNFRESNKRAKESVGDVALFASIAGTRQAPLSYVGALVNPIGTNMLIHSQGMVSAILESANFTTAFSDAYRPAEINLNNPVPSMGIIGMSIDKKGQSHYTVRLLPSQAQKKFKQAIENLFTSNLTSEQKTIVLSEFTKIVQAWDRLICGDGNHNQISLEDYVKQRNNIVSNLRKQGLIDLRSLDLEGKTIQMYLNDALKQAAKDIFNPIRLARARAEIETIFKS